MDKKRNILIAPLNWGLGHATRCIPIIKELLKFHYTPIIAGDGESLRLLNKEFSTLKFVELPGYGIEYSRYKNLIKYKLLLDSRRILRVIREENDIIKNLAKNLNLKGIISDNRFGVRHPDIPSVLMTHQINVLSGNTTWLSTTINTKFINKFDQCWIPDYPGKTNLSGKLSHGNSLKIPINYIGPISRFIKAKSQDSIDLLIILSGPPPYRKMLEDQLLHNLQQFNGKIIMVKGVIETRSKMTKIGNVEVYNFLSSRELEGMINDAKLILCRSGYSSIMDLAKLGKKAFFIPTPGQYEQEYLAKRMEKLKIAPYCEQENFKLDQLKTVDDYTGFSGIDKQFNFKELFSLFEGK